MSTDTQQKTIPQIQVQALGEILGHPVLSTHQDDIVSLAIGGITKQQAHACRFLVEHAKPLFPNSPVDLPAVASNLVERARTIVREAIDAGIEMDDRPFYDFLQAKHSDEMVWYRNAAMLAVAGVTDPSESLLINLKMAASSGSLS